MVGIEQVGQNQFRSVRPMPPSRFAWPIELGLQRGTFICFEPVATSAAPPHVEDQNTHGLQQGGELLAEDELVDVLQHAETSEHTEGLFGCGLHSGQLGGNKWVPPDSASRSICGCVYVNLRFRIFMDSDRPKLMAMLSLSSGEVLHSLPVVDWAWRQFLAQMMSRFPRRPAQKDVDAFFNRNIRTRVMDSPTHFVRIGLPRPRRDEHKCWLMLDTLFPQPDPAWLQAP